MAIIYFHPSTLVRLAVERVPDPLSRQLWDRADALVSARSCDLEVRAVLAGGLRQQKLTETIYQQAVSRWQELFGSLWLAEPDTEQYELAAQIVQQHGVRVTDAMHLAAADRFRTGGGYFYTLDSSLRSVASELDLSVIEAEA